MTAGYIKYCPHHIKSGAPIENIPFSEVKAKLGFNYMNNTLKMAWQSVLDVWLPNKPIFHTCKFNLLADPEATIVVHEASPHIGKSLTTIKPIPKCTIIAEYSGNIVDLNIHGDQVYTFNNGYSKATLAPVFNPLKAHKAKDSARYELADKYINAALKGLFPDHEYYGPLGKPITKIQIDARDSGNLARFASHMPTEEQTSKGYKVATANLNSACVPSMEGIVKCFLFAQKNIKAEEELGWDYSDTYSFGWSGPLFFEQNSHMLIYRNGSLHNANFDYNPPETMGNIEAHGEL